MRSSYGNDLIVQCTAACGTSKADVGAGRLLPAVIAGTQEWVLTSFMALLIEPDLGVDQSPMSNGFQHRLGLIRFR
jgi:hypothetical protein